MDQQASDATGRSFAGISRLATIGREPRRIPDRRRNAAFALAQPVVHVLDADVALRTSLGTLLHGMGWRVEGFSTARAFLAHARTSAPQCLLLELVLPDIGGLALQARMGRDPTLPILFIAGQGDVPTSVRAMKAGAFDFLLKPLSKDTLLRAIGDALAASKAALERAAIARALDVRYASLTPREREVMHGVATGLLN